jgi:hypothetical protein
MPLGFWGEKIFDLWHNKNRNYELSRNVTTWPQPRAKPRLSAPNKIKSVTRNGEDRQCTYNVILRRVHETIVTVEKQKVLHIGLRVHACAWACACAYVRISLLIQHATRMRHIVTSFVAPRSPLYFSVLSHKQCDFRKKKLLKIKRVFSFFCVWNISHSKKNLAKYRQKYRNVFTWSTHYFCRILKKLNFSPQIFEKKKSSKYQVLSKCVQWEPSRSMRTDRRTWS